MPSQRQHNVTNAQHSLDVDGAWDTLRSLANQEVVAANYPVLPSDTAPQYPRLGQTPFAVVDIETTGFSGLHDDRLIDLAVVHTDPHGHITDQWITLVNPDRDPGPTWPHGIHPEDLTEAPYFIELAGWLTTLLDGRVVVAHNAPYDAPSSPIRTSRRRASELADPVHHGPGPQARLTRLRLATVLLRVCRHTSDTGAHSPRRRRSNRRSTPLALAQTLSTGMRMFAELGCKSPLPMTEPVGTPMPRLRPR